MFVSQKAKDILLKQSGKDHPVYAASLTGLAGLYYAMGRYDEAELLFLEVRDIRLTQLGKDHPDYAASLNNLALLYKAMGRYGRLKRIIWHPTKQKNQPVFMTKQQQMMRRGSFGRIEWVREGG